MSLRQIIKKTLNEHKSKRTVYIYTQPEVKTLNRILNSDQFSQCFHFRKKE